MVTEYPYRSTRLDLNVPLWFEVEGARVRGQCLNVSESGLLTKLDRIVDIWVVGELSLSIYEYELNIKARVARLVDRDTGLAFMTKSEADRRTVRMLMDIASASSRER